MSVWGDVAGQTGTIDLLERDTAEQPAVDGPGGTDYPGWFCLNTTPWRCPGEGCEFVAEWITAAHLIIVWEERDDPELLRHARRAAEVGRNPRVREYDPDFGPAIGYYEWVEIGRPVHAIKGGKNGPKPSWW